MLAAIIASGAPVGGGNVDGIPFDQIPASDWVLLALWVGGALAISFTCSLLEAVVMSVNEYKLMADAEKGDAGAQRMLKIKENTADAIAAILTLNTVAHTVGATLSGAQALKMFGSAQMGLFSGILTLLILVLTEIIPKNAGERNAEKYSGFCSLILNFVIMIMYPLVKMNGVLVKLMFGEHEEKLTKDVVKAVQKQAIEDGALDETEGTRLQRVIGLADKTTAELQIPFEEVGVVPSSFTLKELSEEGEHSQYTRILVYGEKKTDILGYVYLEEAFRSVLLGINSSEQTLAEAKALLGNASGEKALIRDVSSCSAGSSAKDVLQSMLKHHLHIIIVKDEAGLPTGIITLEEFMENLLDHDIQDEDDPVQGFEAEEALYNETRPISK